MQPDLYDRIPGRFMSFLYSNLGRDMYMGKHLPSYRLQMGADSQKSIIYHLQIPRGLYIKPALFKALWWLYPWSSELFSVLSANGWWSLSPGTDKAILMSTSSRWMLFLRLLPTTKPCLSNCTLWINFPSFLKISGLISDLISLDDRRALMAKSEEIEAQIPLWTIVGLFL